MNDSSDALRKEKFKKLNQSLFEVPENQVKVFFSSKVLIISNQGRKRPQIRRKRGKDRERDEEGKKRKEYEKFEVIYP